MKSEQENNKNVHSKLFSSSMFMLITRLSIKSLGLINTIILARFLMPEDFGLVAIAMAIYAFIELFGALGFATVLIQKQNKSTDDYNTAWTFKVIFGAITALVLILAAEPVATFYADERLVLIIYAIAAVAFVGSLSNIGVVDFQKDLEFDKEFKFQLLPKLFSFTLTVALAVYLQNYWALILGNLSNQLAIVVLSYVMHPHRPKFTLVSFSSLFNFSKWLLLNNVVFFLNNKMTELLIGRLLSTKAIGVYAMANEIASLPTTEIAAPINRASFPVYSKFANQMAELRHAYLNTMAMSFSLTAAASIGIYLVADLFVINVLGDNWLDAIPVIEWIALSSLLFSLSTNNAYIYLACGKPKYSFFIGLCRAIIFLASLIYLVDIYGLEGTGYAMMITAAAMFVATQIAIVSYMKLNILSMVGRIIRPLSASMAMLLATLWFKDTYLDSGFGSLVLTMAFGAVVYITVLLVLWKVWGRKEDIENVLWQQIKNKLPF